MPTTNSYPTTATSTATPPYPPQTTSSNLSMQSNTGTITEEHIHASLLSAVEDKLKKRLREVLAQSQVISLPCFNLCFYFIIQYSADYPDYPIIRINQVYYYAFIQHFSKFFLQKFIFFCRFFEGG